ncbi:MAG: hypothetical protein JO056_03610 [Alphaproteobacteria bacterium]|nr:hypothetical protein [Alphaproteobacteria bacterium]
MHRIEPLALAFLAGSCLTNSIEASASNFKILYSFCHDNKFVCSDGKSPAANLIRDAEGNLYGTTTAGGATGNGVIFELVHSAGKYKYQVLHDFDGNSDGGVPVTPLIMDVAGNLYGTATAGGAIFGGTAFQLSPNAERTKWTYKVLINFCSSAGENCILGMVPESPLTYAGAAAGQLYDGASPLYGTTLTGGSNGVGTAYQLTNTGGKWTGNIIYSFCSVAGCADGEFPGGQLVLDNSGHLFGTTNGGGSSENSSGVAYRISTKTGVQSVVYNFCSKTDCVDGSGPLLGLTLHDGPQFFGATAVGGKFGSGTVYSLNAANDREQVLYSFCKRTDCADGVGPTAPIIEFGGALIGTARGGNSTSAGVIFRIGAGDKEAVLHTFCAEADCTDGSQPVGVIADDAGNLFGVTQAGGKKNWGIVYKLAK